MKARRTVVTDASPWLTTAEAMRYLRCRSRSALYRLIREHRLPHGMKGGQYLFRKDHLDRWLETAAGIVVERAS